MLKDILKIFFISLVLSPIFIVCSEYSIIFVHLGTHFPNYIKDSLEQARLFNADTDIYLIQNQGARTTPDDRQILQNCNIKIVFAEDLFRSNVHYEFLKKTVLDDTIFRDGFWRKATERFFYLEECMRQYNLNSVFHLENDIMLYVDLNELISIFRQYKNIAAIFDNDIRCVPSLIYFNNANSLQKLLKYFVDYAKSGLTDMQIPPFLRDREGRDTIDYLPVIMKKYCDDHPLMNLVGQKAKNSSVFFNRIDEFNSIFDGAAIGQYLGGIDPRNAPLGPGFISSECFFNPSHFSFEWVLDEKNRKVPFVIYKGEKYRLNNLHIHCKDLKKFKSS